jgi:hypothetical protein
VLHLVAALVLAAAPATKSTPAPAKRAATPAAAPAAAPATVGAPTQHFANAPSILHITSEKFMAMVLVDGTPLQQTDCTSPKACDVVDIAPGPHELDIRGGAFGTKPIFKGFVTVTGGAEVWGKAKDNQFTIYNTQARALPPGEPVYVAQPSTTTQTTTTTVANGGAVPAGGVAIGMSFTDPDTGEQVNMGVSAGAFGGTATVTEQTTTTTTVASTSAPVTVSGKAGVLELTSQDGESFTVFLDGKKVGTFNGLEGQSIKVKNVAPGEHKLVIKDFMENAIWTSGRLLMDPGFTLKLGVDENQGVEAFNRQAAWRPGF